LLVALPGVELLFKLVEAYEQVGLKAFWGASLKRLQEADKLQKSGTSCFSFDQYVADWLVSGMMLQGKRSTGGSCGRRPFSVWVTSPTSSATKTAKCIRVVPGRRALHVSVIGFDGSEFNVQDFAKGILLPDLDVGNKVG
jgi:hypothetical protein